MARLPRLSVAHLPHLVTLYGHSRQPVFVDDQDRRQFRDAWREAAAPHQVALHGLVLADDHLHLLATPATPEGLGRCIQALGRRYVAQFNRRHGRSGTLWAGRYRATVLQPGATALDALLFIDLHPQRAGWPGDVADAPFCSAAHHLGRQRDPLLSPLPAQWALGNTPFEREAAYRRRIDDGLPLARARQLADAARLGWPLGDAQFVQQLASHSPRPVGPRRRGRPARILPAAGESVDI